ncbi:MAG: hypothetical protein ABJG15_04670 [Hyphomonadaceae bacterium]
MAKHSVEILLAGRSDIGPHGRRFVHAVKDMDVPVRSGVRQADEGRGIEQGMPGAGSEGPVRGLGYGSTALALSPA